MAAMKMMVVILVVDSDSIGRKHGMTTITTTATPIWYGDGAGNTVEENSSIFSLIWMR